MTKRVEGRVISDIEYDRDMAAREAWDQREAGVDELHRRMDKSESVVVSLFKALIAPGKK